MKPKNQLGLEVFVLFRHAKKPMLKDCSKRFFFAMKGIVQEET
jgi:hypothetical protein